MWRSPGGSHASTMRGPDDGLPVRRRWLGWTEQPRSEIVSPRWSSRYNVLVNLRGRRGHLQVRQSISQRARSVPDRPLVGSPRKQRISSPGRDRWQERHERPASAPQNRRCSVRRTPRSRCSSATDAGHEGARRSSRVTAGQDPTLFSSPVNRCRPRSQSHR